MKKQSIPANGHSAAWTLVAIFGDLVFESTFASLGEAAGRIASSPEFAYPRGRSGLVPPAHRWTPSPDDGMDIVAVSEHFSGERVVRSLRLRISIISPNGRRVRVEEALRSVDNAARLRRLSWRSRLLADWNGEGPVPGIGIHRYRRRRSPYGMIFADKRLSLDTIDGAPPPRPNRNIASLPDGWDRMPRSTSKSWKDQGRRGAQWDRARSAGSHRLCSRNLAGVDE